jgi:hypothetical protein
MYGIPLSKRLTAVILYPVESCYLNIVTRKYKPLFSFSIKNTEISVDFWDPSNFLAKARKITYFWFVDSVPFGQSSQVQIRLTAERYMHIASVGGSGPF